MRPPRLSLESFPRASLDLPDTPPNEYWASASIAALPGVPGLVSSFCSSSPSFGIGSLQTPPRSGRPGLASRFRSSRSAENSHLRDSKHAWQTKRAAPGIRHGSASARLTAYRCTVVLFANCIIATRSSWFKIKIFEQRRRGTPCEAVSLCKTIGDKEVPRPSAPSPVHQGGPIGGRSASSSRNRPQLAHVGAVAQAAARNRNSSESGVGTVRSRAWPRTMRSASIRSR